MKIKDRNLTVGTRLIGKYHKQEYTCQVIAGENDKLKYKLEDGGIQEPVSSGYGDYEPCLRRVGLLECRNSDRESFGRDSAGSECQCHGKHQPDGSRVGPCCQTGRCSGDGNCPGCPGSHYRQEDLPAHSQSEGSTTRSDQMVLRRVWGKLLGILRRDSRHLPSGSQSLVLAKNPIVTPQAPLSRSLCFVGVTKVTASYRGACYPC